MQFEVDVFIKVIGMDVVFEMELVLIHLELYNSRYEKNTESGSRLTYFLC
jgi:hypothetical protein